MAQPDHTSVLVDKKLYFSGGDNLNGSLNDFFYLDVSQQFNITSLPWNDITFTGDLRSSGASACSGRNINYLFIFGGRINSKKFVLKYDINNQTWTYVISGRKRPTNRIYISCSKFNNRSIAIFGGYNIEEEEVITNDLWIFDSLELTWNLSNASNALNAPPAIWSYCAITLLDETILYIGRMFYDINNDADIPMPLNSLPLYDSTSDTWKSLDTSGPTPPSRRAFSAVLTSDNRIIIFGGLDVGFSTLGDLWILDIATKQWSAGNISNPNGLAISSHTATLVDNYMIVAFGSYNITNESSTLYMLDVSRRDFYTWVTEFIP
ncbi:10220_t:CDS:2, partial [Gigaspora margarita]